MYVSIKVKSSRYRRAISLGYKQWTVTYPVNWETQENCSKIFLPRMCPRRQMTQEIYGLSTVSLVWEITQTNDDSPRHWSIEYPKTPIDPSIFLCLLLELLAVNQAAWKQLFWMSRNFKSRANGYLPGVHLEIKFLVSLLACGTAMLHVLHIVCCYLCLAYHIPGYYPMPLYKLYRL